MDGGFEERVREQLRHESYHLVFEALLDRFQSKVFRLCCSILADEALAQDASQDVFFSVWRALPSFRAESSISTWIYAITRNTCLTRLQRERGRKTVPLSAAEGPDERSVRHAADLEIRSMVARLPEKHRQVLVLFYYADKSYEEVAAMLDLPLGTVKTYLYRAKKELVLMQEACHGVS